MGAGAAYCENLPQMPDRSSLVLFLACSFTSSETSTILRPVSVYLTSMQGSLAWNNFSASLPPIPHSGSDTICFFHLKTVVWGEDSALQATQLSSGGMQVGFDTGGKVFGLRMKNDCQELPSTPKRAPCKHYFHQLPTPLTQPQYLGIKSLILPWIFKTLLD